jgi:hypothetical protein
MGSFARRAGFEWYECRILLDTCLVGLCDECPHADDKRSELMSSSSYTTDALASRIGVSTRTINRWRKAS